VVLSDDDLRLAKLGVLKFLKETWPSKGGTSIALSFSSCLTEQARARVCNDNWQTINFRRHLNASCRFDGRRRVNTTEFTHRRELELVGGGTGRLA
jgi:hypothetical protein